MKKLCNMDLCTGCSVCMDVCPKDAIKIEEDIEFVKAHVDERKCINCKKCERICPAINKIELSIPIAWYQGWAEEEEDRDKSSSGGFAYAMAEKVLEESGSVVSCIFKDGSFEYGIIEKKEELWRIRGSKYVKSNPMGIYSKVYNMLSDDHLVLFIGLPCHVAALKQYLKTDYVNLITVDLICHGTPSLSLLDLFLQQYNIHRGDIESLYFRKKNVFRLYGETNHNKQIAFSEPAIRDLYTIAFLNGLSYTENCYHCKYAGIHRVSDITIGDSWGNELQEEEKKKGVSLALCQTEKGISLIHRSKVHIFSVDKEKAIAANHQLREPFPITESRKRFFRLLRKKKTFNQAVSICYPKVCIKLCIKTILYRMCHRHTK